MRDFAKLGIGTLFPKISHQERSYQTTSFSVLRHSVLTIVLGLSVSACVAPGSDTASKYGLTEEAATVIFEAAIAGTIVHNCPSRLRYNAGAEAEIFAATKKREEAANAIPLTDAEFNRRKKEFYDDYLERREIKDVNKATWCAAGAADVAEGTGIGKLLIPR